MPKDKGLTRFYAFLARPLFFKARFALAACVVPLVIGSLSPLWRIELRAPEYPGGLSLDVYAFAIESGHGGRDLDDINTLNHYVGMKPLERHDLTDLDWLPFALGALAVLTLRCAAIGNVSALVDLVVVTFFAGAFAFGRFVYRLHSYGHGLSPDAPYKVEPFTPPIFGTKVVGSIETFAGPRSGAYFVAAFAVAIALVLAWHLVAGRRAALREASEARAAA